MFSRLCSASRRVICSAAPLRVPLLQQRCARLFSSAPPQARTVEITLGGALAAVAGTIVVVRALSNAKAPRRLYDRVAPWSEVEKCLLRYDPPLAQVRTAEEALRSVAAIRALETEREEAVRVYDHAFLKRLVVELLTHCASPQVDDTQVTPTNNRFERANVRLDRVVNAFTDTKRRAFHAMIKRNDRVLIRGADVQGLDATYKDFAFYFSAGHELFGDRGLCLHLRMQLAERR